MPTKPAYYNEVDNYCSAWLRNLISAGHLPPGDVDERDIRAVQPAELAGYGQRHFFAGLGGWAYACRLAGVPDDCDLITGSPPCQPFSVAGRLRGTTDDRHLWPEMARLVAALRPAAVAVENVANVVGLALDGMLSDLEGAGYSSRAFVLPACAVDAPHRRDRVWIVARPVGDPGGAGLPISQQRGEPSAAERGQQPGPAVAQPSRPPGAVEHAEGERRAEGRAEPGLRGRGAAAAVAGGAGALADAARELLDRGGDAGPRRRREPANDGGAGAVADAGGERRERGPGVDGDGRQAPERRQAGDHAGNGGGAGALADRAQPGREARAGDGLRDGPRAEQGSAARGGGAGALADADRTGPGEGRQQRGGQQLRAGGDQGPCAGGFWDGAGWIAGRDGKRRRIPVEPFRRMASRLSPGMAGVCPDNSSEKEVTGAQESNPGTAETVRNVRDDDGAQTLRRTVGGHGGIQTAPVLFAEMRQYQAGREPEAIASEGQEVPQVGVRGMRGDHEAARPSFGREPEEQRPVEPSDVVRLVSSSLALGQWQDQSETAVGLHNLLSACAEAGYVPETLSALPALWRSMPDQARRRVGEILIGTGNFAWRVRPILSRGEQARVQKLRALGNSIVPQVAAEILRAMNASSPEGLIALTADTEWR